MGGPFDEAWDANATFPEFALMTAENSIGTEGVGFGVVVVSIVAVVTAVGVDFGFDFGFHVKLKFNATFQNF